MLQSMNFLLLKHNRGLAGECCPAPLAVHKWANFVARSTEEIDDIALGGCSGIGEHTEGILELGLQKQLHFLLDNHFFSNLYFI